MADPAEPLNDVPEAAPSVRDALTAAMADASASDGAQPGPAPLSAPAAPETDGNAHGKPVRDPAGRFAPGSKEALSSSPETNAPLAPELEQPASAIRPPASWSATAKADFDKLPAHIQTEVLKREREIETGNAQWNQKGHRLNRLDAVLAPRHERFKLAGIDEVQAVQTLFAAQDMLESPDPNVRASAIQYLARQSGVDLRSLAGSPAPQPQPGAQQAQPGVLDTVLREVAALEQNWTQQQQSAHQQSLSETQQEIETFAADTTNRYFANVRNDMGRLIAAGQAASLKDAYDKACWGNPEIRDLLIRERQTAETAERERQARERASAARRASGSITGSPTPGASQVNSGPSPSVREELERQFSVSA